ncbi:PREDICTED: zinc finger protein 431-like [Branchiostoma belcheri]|uniref:Zinc finger protein 431-like n=1 Tax=Branchiostoma belcheri TaxID=7741 RepID=A0A6P5ATL2_BRABE|nr:PREDICTED: zinc finger protein 431-like [Branchiostoma belcheri]
MAETSSKPIAGTSHRSCTLCKFTASNQKDLESHMFSHVREPMWVCDTCGYRSNRHSAMERHSRKHKKKCIVEKKSRPVPDNARCCPLCKFTTADQKQLESHMFSHVEPMVCETCGYRALSHSTMARHIKTHAEKPFKPAPNVKQEIVYRTCPLCKFTTTDQKKLESHMFKHTYPIVCQQCGFRALSQRTMKKHMETHTTEDESVTAASDNALSTSTDISQHRCSVCGFTTPDQREFESHKSSHTTYAGKPFMCGECMYRTSCMFTLQMHMKTHVDEMSTVCDNGLDSERSQDKMAANSEPSQDKMAVKIEPSQDKMAANSRSSQDKMAANNGSSQDKMAVKIEPSQDKMAANIGPGQNKMAANTEPSQDKMAANSEPSQDKMAANSGPSQEKMAANSGPSQDKVAANTSGMETYSSDTQKYTSAVLEQHIEQDKSKMSENVATSATDKALRCEECDFRTNVEHALQKHMICHTLPFMCGECGHRAVTKYQMDAHMRTHTGETPFLCGKCGYNAANKRGLTKHMQIHTGGIFTCKKCEYTTTLMGDFNQHLRAHRGEISFECEVCGLKTSTKGAMASHMRIHTHELPYACSKCEYRTTCQDDLAEHIQTHTLNEKPVMFVCGKCGLQTPNRGAMAIHMKIHLP